MRPFTRERLAAEYRYIEDLSSEGVIWELERRDPEYQAAYQDAAQAQADPAPAAAPEPSRRWRLRFRREP